MSQTPEGTPLDKNTRSIPPEKPAAGSEHNAPKYVLHLGDLSLRQVLRLHHALRSERNDVERTHPQRDWLKDGNSDELPPLRHYPHIADPVDSLTQAWWHGINELIANDLNRVKDIANSFKDSDDIEARKSAGFIAAKIAPHDHKFARDLWRVLDADPDWNVADAAFHSRIGIEDRLTPEQVDDLERYFPPAEE